MRKELHGGVAAGEGVMVAVLCSLVLFYAMKQHNTHNTSKNPFMICSVPL